MAIEAARKYFPTLSSSNFLRKKEKKKKKKKSKLYNQSLQRNTSNDHKSVFSLILRHTILSDRSNKRIKR